MPDRVVIVGAGQAAVQALDVLRRRGFEGSIALIGDEPHAPYQRPPLSKKYLTGELSAGRLPFKQPQFYADHGVDARFGRRVVRIDRGRACVELDDGSSLNYDRLLLTTGSRARPVAIAGAALEGVHCLRTLADAEHLRTALHPGLQLVVLGGGYIGLEVAATARTLGLDVTVLEAAPRVMSRVICPEMSAFFQGEHVRRGVRIENNARVRAVLARGGGAKADGVQLEDGRIVDADVVLIAVGSAAVDELAASAGLDCADGIVVDEFCRTSDERIYAAGDCTRHPAQRYGSRRVRLESVDNACEQGTSAALNLLGTATVHDRVPWFWSDQFDVKLLIIGVADGADRTVLRGDPASRHFSVCYLRGDELLAIDTVNNPKDQMAARKIIAARGHVDPKRLENPDIPLAECRR